MSKERRREREMSVIERMEMMMQQQSQQPQDQYSTDNMSNPIDYNHLFKQNHNPISNDPSPHLLTHQTQQIFLHKSK